MRPPKETSDSEHTLKWWSWPGVVYFLGVGEPRTAIKIGMLAQTGTQALNQAIVRRLTKIQTANHESVELLGILLFTEGPYPTRQADARERELHIQFAHLERFKAGTCGAEWFNAGPDLVAFIEREAKAPETLGLPRFVCVRKKAENTEAQQRALAAVPGSAGVSLAPLARHG
jgi:hypothetical protein